MVIFNNFSNLTSGVPPFNPTVRASANFSGANGTLAGSFNVVSVTKNGVGNYTVNFDNPFLDTEYFVCCHLGQTNRIFSYDSKAVGSVNIRVQDSTLGLAADATEVSVLIFAGEQ